MNRATNERTEAETQTFERDSSRFRGGRKTPNERNFARDSVTLSLFHLAFFPRVINVREEFYLARPAAARRCTRSSRERSHFYAVFTLITYIAMPPNGSFTALCCLRFHFGGNMLMECPEIIHVSLTFITRGNQQRERPLRERAGGEGGGGKIRRTFLPEENPKFSSLAATLIVRASNDHPF